MNYVIVFYQGRFAAIIRSAEQWELFAKHVDQNYDWSDFTFRDRFGHFTNA